MEKNITLFESPRVEKLVTLFLVVASLFVAFQAVSALMKLFEPRPVFGTVITVEGKGKVTAIPDVATITFTVEEQATTAEVAQDKAAQKTNVALALLKEDLSIPEADIKTTSYTIYPRYNQPQPCFGGVCPEYEQRIIGYTVSQMLEVKVRDTNKAGDVIARLGDAGVSNLFGPAFAIDDVETLRAEAREKAIKDAQEKAKVLVRDLGVHIVRITGFWENAGGYPILYAEKAMGRGGTVSSDQVVVPELPLGENEIEVVVSVTYEIR